MTDVKFNNDWSEIGLCQTFRFHVWQNRRANVFSGRLNHVLWNLQYKAYHIPKLKCFSSCIAVVLAQSIEARCYVKNEDVVGAAPIGDAPTTSEWSTILLPAKVPLISEVWQYIMIVKHTYLPKALPANMAEATRPA